MHRVYYADGQVNQAPEAVIDADATFVEEGGTVGFSGAASTDPDGEALLLSGTLMEMALSIPFKWKIHLLTSPLASMTPR